MLGYDVYITEEELNHNYISGDTGEATSISEVLLKKFEDAFDEMKYEEIADIINIVNASLDSYIALTGEVPKPIVLNAMAKVIDWRYMEGDTRPNKTSLEEYPVLTEGQLNRRTKGDNDKNNRGYTNREVSIDHAEYVGSDGVDYRGLFE